MAVDPIRYAGMAQDGAGSSRVTQEGLVATYRLGVKGVTVAATATDIVTLNASTSKLVKIRRVRVSGAAGTAGMQTIILLRRSTLDTGGTSTNPVGVPVDSADGAALAVVNQYSANPGALGTVVGIIGARRIYLNVAATGASDNMEWLFGQNGTKCPALRAGTTEQFAINGNGDAIPASASLDYEIEWTEE